jgi:glutathione-specific gamma-glutamylcyclotransferase
VPRWVNVYTASGMARAITFEINHAHERYARDLSDDETAEAIAHASGFLGACADYLINTVDHLAELGIHDRPLERRRERVLAERTAEPFSA